MTELKKLQKIVKENFNSDDDIDLSAKERYFRDLKRKLNSPQEIEKRIEKAIENLKKKWR